MKGLRDAAASRLTGVAQHLTGCHLDADAVLPCLRREWPRPWGRGVGDDADGADVFDELQRRILAP